MCSGIRSFTIYLLFSVLVGTAVADEPLAQPPYSEPLSPLTKYLVGAINEEEFQKEMEAVLVVENVFMYDGRIINIVLPDEIHGLYSVVDEVPAMIALETDGQETKGTLTVLSDSPYVGDQIHEILHHEILHHDLEYRMVYVPINPRPVTVEEMTFFTELMIDSLLLCETQSYFFFEKTVCGISGVSYRLSPWIISLLGLFLIPVWIMKNREDRTPHQSV